MKKNSERNNRITVERLAGAILFFVLLYFVFSRITYLFRNTGFEREHVVGIKSEEKIDVVYIGGSAAYDYWEPLKAFEDCGFTSYNLATSGIGVESLLPYIKYAEKYQNPDLYIVGIRSFQYFDDGFFEAGLRNASDSMNIESLQRYEMVNSYFRNRDLCKDYDVASFYFDVSKYHTNTENLGNAEAWSFINNKGKSIFKGFESPEAWTYLKVFSDFKTEERVELSPELNRELERILEYCDRKNLQVLFVVCPYAITSDHYAIYNSIADEVIEHGYGYINANDYYSEMGIDFSKDFYNVYHVNIYGAEKYTSFLEKFIMSNYELPDHRSDGRYESWYESLHDFKNYTAYAKEIIDGYISEANLAVAQGDEIRKTNDFARWCDYVKNSCYSLIVVGNGKELNTDDILARKKLECLGFDISDLFESDNIVKMITENTTILDSATVTEDSMLACVGVEPSSAQITVDNRDNNCSVIISDEEYSRKDNEGLNVVVFDNNYHTVIDSVTLKLKDKKVVLVR